MIPASIGVIANPSSGRDIRRLLAWASVFPTHEKVQTVLRLLAPMGRLGVAEAWMIPDQAGIAQRVRDEAADAVRRGVPMPAVRLINMAVNDGPGDSATAAGWLRARGAALIAVLGGDGTHRAVAAHCGSVPLATMSTGTNNAFPDRREATLVGMAAALAATGRVPAAYRPRSAFDPTRRCTCAAPAWTSVRWSMWPCHASRGWGHVPSATETR